MIRRWIQRMIVPQQLPCYCPCDPFVFGHACRGEPISSALPAVAPWGPG